MERMLELLSWVSNRSITQTRQLYVLCLESFDVLMLLEAKIKMHHISYCPATKQEVDTILELPSFQTK